MADSIYKWSTTAASNDQADSIINWRENQLPDTINDSARSMMKRIAEFRDDLTGGLVTAGTQPAYTLTTSAQFDSLANGRLLTCRVHATNTGPATLNVNGLGAKKVRKYGSTGDMDLGTGDLQLNGVYQMMYSAGADNGAGAWIANNPSLSTGGGFASGTALVFAQAASPVGWTKSATNDNKALRVVSGTTGGAAGGTIAFTDCLTNRSGTTGDVALTAAQIPAHAHTQQGSFNTGAVSADHSHYFSGTFGSGGFSNTHNHTARNGGSFMAIWGSGANNVGLNGQAGGTDGGSPTNDASANHSHNTGVSGSTGGISANHTHAVTISGATANAGGGGTHNHTMALDFSIQYLDVIVCIKD